MMVLVDSHQTDPPHRSLSLPPPCSDAELEDISSRRKPSIKTQKKQANSLLNSLNSMDPKVQGGKKRRRSFSSLTPKSSTKSMKDQTVDQRPASPERRVQPAAKKGENAPTPTGCCVIS